MIASYTLQAVLSGYSESGSVPRGQREVKVKDTLDSKARILVEITLFW